MVAPPLESCHALVLNADFRPISYFPLSLWHWHDSVRAVFGERVNVLSEYDRAVRSPCFEVRLPSVIALKRYIQPARRPAFTRFNLFLRDSFTCQYCGSRDELTFDHLLPRSQGGRTTWANVTSACAGCNLRKGGSTPDQCGMRPRRFPRVPSVHELHALGRAFPPNYLHDSWRDYLYWDTELET